MSPGNAPARRFALNKCSSPHGSSAKATAEFSLQFHQGGLFGHHRRVPSYRIGQLHAIGNHIPDKPQLSVGIDALSNLHVSSGSAITLSIDRGLFFGGIKGRIGHAKIKHDRAISDSTCIVVRSLLLLLRNHYFRVRFNCRHDRSWCAIE